MGEPLQNKRSPFISILSQNHRCDGARPARIIHTDSHSSEAEYRSRLNPLRYSLGHGPPFPVSWRLAKPETARMQVGGPRACGMWWPDHRCACAGAQRNAADQGWHNLAGFRAFRLGRLGGRGARRQRSSDPAGRCQRNGSEMLVQDEIHVHAACRPLTTEPRLKPTSC
jgi:hypothetical protein